MQASSLKPGLWQARRVSRRGRGWRPPLRALVRPRHEAGESLTHLHPPHQVMHGAAATPGSKVFSEICLSAAFSGSAGVPHH